MKPTIYIQELPPADGHIATFVARAAVVLRDEDAQTEEHFRFKTEPCATKELARKELIEGTPGLFDAICPDGVWANQWEDETQ